MAGYRFWMLACGVPAALLMGPIAAQAVESDQIAYVIRPGDTLINLAKAYFITPGSYAEVQKLNHISKDRRMPVGMVLHVPRRLLKFDVISFRLSSFSGPVSAILGKQALPLQKGMVLGEGVQLTTGPNGFVSLSGADGSRVALPSNSRIRILHARHYLLPNAADIDFGIEQGRAEVEAAKQKPLDQFQIHSPVAVSAVRGTVFRAGINGVGSSGSTEVIEGNVAVISPKAESAIPAGYGASVMSSGEIAKEALLAPPQLLQPGHVQTEDRLHFDFSPVAGSASYRTQIARDAGFEDVLTEQIAGEPQGEFPSIGNGTFFVRATAIAGSGIEGLPEVWSFRRQRVGLAAEAGQSAIPGGLRIKWHSEGEGRAIFRFQLFAAGKPDVPVVDEAGLENNGITLTGLARGAYLWRVGVVRVIPEGSAEVWTPMQKFNVSN